MSLVHTQQETYSPITEMLRKREGRHFVGRAGRRPALATISRVPNSSLHLAKQLKQRQEKPLRVKVYTKKLSSKQKQLASRSKWTTSTNPRVAAAIRQFILPSLASTENFPVTSSSNGLGFSAFKDPTPYPNVQTPTDMMELGVNDIDKGAGVLESPEYVAEIDCYLRECEISYKPRANYMAKQQQISFTHRTTVLDWMYEVCDELHLNQKTFQLAVSYVDRFMSKMSMPRRNLQLLGTTALYIAYKVEETEMSHGLAAKFVWITENTYTVSELFRMENLLLKTLDFEMNSTTTCSFVDRFLKASKADCRETYFTEFLCDRSAVKGERFLNYTPSLLTAAAVGLAKATFRPGLPVWTPTLAHYTKYSYGQVSQCMADLLNLYTSDFGAATRQFAAVWNKYNKAKYLMILQSAPLQSIPAH